METSTTAIGSKSRDSDLSYKCKPSDFHDGTRELSLELRGAYNDVLNLIYMHGGALPCSDRVMAAQLVVDVRKWKHIKQKLIAAGKLFLTPEGHLHNRRAEEELAERKAARHRRSNGQRPANDGRSTSSGSRCDRPAIDDRLGGGDGETPNDLNETADKLADTRAREQDSQRADADSEQRCSPQPARLEDDAAQELAGLNGTAQRMISDIARWMGGDPASAREWLSKTIGIYGCDTVRDAYAKLITDMAEGRIIARPIQTLNSIAQRMRERPARTKAVASTSGPPTKRYWGVKSASQAA